MNGDTDYIDLENGDNNYEDAESGYNEYDDVETGEDDPGDDVDEETVATYGLEELFGNVVPQTNHKQKGNHQQPSNEQQPSANSRQPPNDSSRKPVMIHILIHNHMIISIFIINNI